MQHVNEEIKILLFIDLLMDKRNILSHIYIVYTPRHSLFIDPFILQKFQPRYFCHTTINRIKNISSATYEHELIST